MSIDIIDINGKKSSTLNISEEIFNSVNEDLFYEVVKMQLANRRLGTACTKTRSEVSGGGAKPWKQKGSGRARAGTTRSPIWRHGGTCFGPKPRDYSYNVPKKVARAALKSAITLKIREDKLRVFDKFELSEPKCKELSGVLKGNSIGSALIVDGEQNKNLKLAARNLRSVKFLYTPGINVYDVLDHEYLVMTKESFEKVETLLK